MKIMFLPERNDIGYELRRCRYERGLTMPNATLFRDSYINIGLATNFSTSQPSIV